jgi:hypothetical protein
MLVGFVAVSLVIVVWGGIEAARRLRSAPRPVDEAAAPAKSPAPAESSPRPKGSDERPAAERAPEPAKPESAPAPAKPESAPATFPPTAVLHAVRHTSNPASTAVELELDRPVAAHAEALHDPERVYFDLPDTAIATSFGALTVDVADARVRRVRVAGHDAATRVVVDLNCSCAYSFAMSQKPPYLLTVTIQAK